WIQVALLVFLTTPSIQDVVDTSAEFESLQKEIFEWQQQEYPEYFNTPNQRYNTYTIDRFKANKKKVDEFLTRLKQIKPDKFTRKGNLKYMLTQNMLQKKIDGYPWYLYGPLTPVSFMEPNLDVMNLFTHLTNNYTVDNIEYVLNTLKTLPEKLSEYETLMQEAIKLKHTLHNVSITHLIGRMDSIINNSESEFIKKSLNYIAKINTSMEVKSRLESQVNKTIAPVMDAIKKFGRFLKNDYLTHTRPEISINSLNASLYQQYLKWHLDSDMTPDKIHQIGLAEAERIKKRVQKIMDKQKFKGTIGEFITNIKKDKQFRMNSTEEILKKYDSFLKKMKPLLPKYFEKFEDVPLIIKTSKFSGPAASYEMSQEEGKTVGIFTLNVQDPSNLFTFEIPNYSLHEGIPGHHFQTTYSLKSHDQTWVTKGSPMDYFMVPYHFPFYTAYVEGWGLYAEYLGEEMGLYATDYEMIGRFEYELLRAYRLVIDTGIHAKNMTRQQGIDLLVKYVGISKEKAAMEIDRYITVPGQACAYKIGEMKIRELRERAEKKLGKDFDLKEFHANILENGRVTLDILEMIVDNMIERKLSANNGVNSLTHTHTLPQTLFSLVLASLIQFYGY
ncbi:uncharacterized protein LOC115219656, partial [Argonauta hians]